MILDPIVLCPMLQKVENHYRQYAGPCVAEDLLYSLESLVPHIGNIDRVQDVGGDRQR